MNQDPVVVQARPVANDTTGSLANTKTVEPFSDGALTWQAWARPLSTPKGSFAVALLNRVDAHNVTATVPFSALYDTFPSAADSHGTRITRSPADAAWNGFEVFDLWQNASSLGVFNESFSATLQSTSAKMLKLVPV